MNVVKIFIDQKINHVGTQRTRTHVSTTMKSEAFTSLYIKVESLIADLVRVMVNWRQTADRHIETLRKSRPEITQSRHNKCYIFSQTTVFFKLPHLQFIVFVFRVSAFCETNNPRFNGFIGHFMDLVLNKVKVCIFFKEIKKKLYNEIQRISVFVV